MPFIMTITVVCFLSCIRKQKLQNTFHNPQIRMKMLCSGIRKYVTLQVQILLKQFNYISKSWAQCHDRRAFLSASLTLEAALGLSLFIFAAVCMLLPMRIMNTERKLQAAMESMGEEFSRYAYIKHAVEHSKPLSAAGTGDFAKAFCKHLVTGAAQGYGMVQLKDHTDTRALEHMSMARTRIQEEGEMIHLVLDYEIRLPFPVPGLPSLQRTAVCSRRAWVGLAGKTYDADGNRTDDPDETVYIGKNSTRYHRSRECHYLSNQLKTVPLASMEDHRNQSGSRYSPCAVCGSQAGTYVYIMPSGKSYHSSAVCRAILAYVKAVPLSQVEHLGACSYCGKGR